MLLPFDLTTAKDIATIVGALLGAIFYSRTEKARKVANGAVDKLNGHAAEIDKLKAVRRRVASQSRRIKKLEQDRTSVIAENRRLESRIETLESRGA
jgi:hypothetical protein